MIIRFELLLGSMISFGLLEGWCVIFWRNWLHIGRANTIKEDYSRSFYKIKTTYGVGMISKIQIKCEKTWLGENKE